jgi:hypothetical protein
LPLRIIRIIRIYFPHSKSRKLTKSSNKIEFREFKNYEAQWLFSAAKSRQIINKQ